jgi:hypothetical protein
MVLDLAPVPDPLIPHIVTITHDAARHFSVWLKDAAGENVDLLANESGVFSGTMELGGGISSREDIKAGGFLVVEADGNWTIDIRPITEAATWDGSSVVSGTGPQVLYVPGGVKTAIPTAVTATGGKSHFSIWTEGRGRDLLVNETAQAYSGVVLVAARTLLVSIDAGQDLTWTLDG